MESKNEIENKILNAKYGKFALRKAIYLDGRDTFPYEIAVVKKVSRASYVIAYLKWNSKEPCWEFSSVGTRYLVDGTEELNEWLLSFCEDYFVDEDGNLKSVYEMETYNQFVKWKSTIGL